MKHQPVPSPDFVAAETAFLRTMLRRRGLIPTERVETGRPRAWVPSDPPPWPPSQTIIESDYVDKSDATP